MDASIAIIEPPKLKRIRTYSPETIAAKNLRRNNRGQIANAEFNTKWLNNEVSVEELQNFNDKK